VGVPLTQRAVAALDAGRFHDEIVPIGDITADESPRRDTSLEKLAR
jgi:acetyl-CoA C-acetyltransferase